MAPVGSGADTSEKRWIPGAQIFDFDHKICDTTTALPHMMPSPEVFAHEARALGINNDSVIVVYDRTGIFSSPRAWWMLKAMGHDAVAVLDGGLPAWVAEGQATTTTVPIAAAHGGFTARPRAGFFCDADTVASALESRGPAVLDARSAGRFAGREPEPRPGLRPGHMPGAGNIPFSQVLKDGRMRSPEDLKALFLQHVAEDRKLIFSCGSGVTACILALAATATGRREISVYDGSWSEWGLPQSGRPVKKP